MSIEPPATDAIGRRWVPLAGGGAACEWRVPRVDVVAPGHGTTDPSVVATALIAYRVALVAGTQHLRNKALDSLLGQRDRHGLWRHWTTDHQWYAQPPPKLMSRGKGRLALAQPDTPPWDSEELATGFCLTAMARLFAAERA